MKPVGARNAPCTVALRSIHPQGWVPIETKFASYISRATTSVAFTPKGGCPLKLPQVSPSDRGYIPVAFTPKGGCPLKPEEFAEIFWRNRIGSIHPQGWVPIETLLWHPALRRLLYPVAFTPKGGCPLKLAQLPRNRRAALYSSIHPQGWVPIETRGQCRCTPNTSPR